MMRLCPSSAGGRLRRENRRRDPNGYIGITTSVLSLDNDLETKRIAKLETYGFPGLEMVGDVDGSSGVGFGAYGPVLGVGIAVSEDGRGVGADLGPDLVGSAIGLENAVLGCAGVV